jgi:quercetin dioxygenase-like cupin family protein
VFRNLPIAEVVTLAELVSYQPGQVVSRTLTQDAGISLTLFAFAAGEGLTPHTSPADALAYVLDGEAVIEIEGQTSIVRAGEAIVMPANRSHALTAEQAFKMLLAIVR